MLDEAGAGQVGVRVVVQGRVSNLQLETLSAADGAYSFNLPVGVYDLGLDREGDPRTATCYYGPVTVGTQENRDFVLRGSGARVASAVWGKLYLQPGVPAAGRPYKLTSHHLPPDSSGRQRLVAGSGVTSSDGSFEANLVTSHDIGVDFEIYDEKGTFDEFIDIGKMSKPCYLEFASELPVATNLLRSYQPGPALQDTASSPPADYVPYNSFFIYGHVPPYYWGYGLIPVSTFTYPNLYDILTANGQNELNATGVQIPQSNILVTHSKRGWYWRYCIWLDVTDSGYDFQFSDQTGDTYHLLVIESGRHWVSYNSAKPAIDQIGFDFGFDFAKINPKGLPERR